MESLGYLFMYFLGGRLPWQGCPGNTKEEKYEKMAAIKRATHIEVLCRGYPGWQYVLLQIVGQNLEQSAELWCFCLKAHSISHLQPYYFWVLRSVQNFVRSTELFVPTVTSNINRASLQNFSFPCSNFFRGIRQVFATCEASRFLREAWLQLLLQSFRVSSK